MKIDESRTMNHAVVTKTKKKQEKEKKAFSIDDVLNYCE